MTTLSSNNITAKILKALLITGLALFALYFFAYQPLQIRKEKQNFAKAETTLDKLAKQIEDEVGKPDQIKKDKSCGYASRVSQRGPRGCGVSVALLYSNRDLVFANSSLADISSLYGTKIYDQLGRPDVIQFSLYAGRGSSQAFSQSIPAQESLNCSVQYSYPVVPLFDKLFPDVSGENVQIYLSCGGSAMAEYYPVK